MLTWKGEFKAYMTSIKHTHTKRKKKKKEKKKKEESFMTVYWYIRTSAEKLHFRFTIVLKFLTYLNMIKFIFIWYTIIIIGERKFEVVSSSWKGWIVPLNHKVLDLENYVHNK